MSRIRGSSGVGCRPDPALPGAGAARGILGEAQGSRGAKQVSNRFLRPSRGGIEGKPGHFPIFHTVAAPFITLEAAGPLARARAEAALEAQSVAGGIKPRGRDGSSPTHGRRCQHPVPAVLGTSRSPGLHLVFNDSPPQQPACTFVIFLKVNLLILETRLERARQAIFQRGSEGKVSCFLMESVLFCFFFLREEEGEINCKIQRG